MIGKLIIYTLFHEKSTKDNLPLKLPALRIADNNFVRKTALIFLGVMLDENVSWNLGRNIS